MSAMPFPASGLERIGKQRISGIEAGFGFRSLQLFCASTDRLRLEQFRRPNSLQELYAHF